MRYLRDHRWMRSDRSGVSGKKKSLFDATICGQCPPSLLYSAGSLQLQIHLWSGFGSPCSKLKCRSSPTTLLNSLCGFLNLEMGEEKKKRQGARKGVEGEGVGWFEENNQASENFWKTASQPKRHNASLWRLNVHDCVCLLENLEGRGRGRRDTCDV